MPQFSPGKLKKKKKKGLGGKRGETRVSTAHYFKCLVLNKTNKKDYETYKETVKYDPYSGKQSIKLKQSTEKKAVMANDSQKT